MKRIPSRKAASVSKLLKIPGMTEYRAEAIREAWGTIDDRAQAMAAVDKLLGSYGVEYLGIHRRSRQHVYYCNAGDVYRRTIIFHGCHLIVDSVRNMIEANKIMEG